MLKTYDYSNIVMRERRDTLDYSDWIHQLGSTKLYFKYTPRRFAYDFSNIVMRERRDTLDYLDWIQQIGSIGSTKLYFKYFSVDAF